MDLVDTLLCPECLYIRTVSSEDECKLKDRMLILEQAHRQGLLALLSLCPQHHLHLPPLASAFTCSSEYIDTLLHYFDIHAIPSIQRLHEHHVLLRDYAQREPLVARELSPVFTVSFAFVSPVELHALLQQLVQGELLCPLDSHLTYYVAGFEKTSQEVTTPSLNAAICETRRKCVLALDYKEEGTGAQRTRVARWYLNDHGQWHMAKVYDHFTRQMRYYPAPDLSSVNSILFDHLCNDITTMARPE